jgi:mRNA interferase YafQ
MYSFKYTSKFKKDYKRCKKRNKDLAKFKDIHLLIVAGKALPEINRDHDLIGNWSGFRECHIEPDWLLIYKIHEEENLIEYVR